MSPCSIDFSKRSFWLLFSLLMVSLGFEQQCILSMRAKDTGTIFTGIIYFKPLRKCWGLVRGTSFSTFSLFSQELAVSDFQYWKRKSCESMFVLNQTWNLTDRSTGNTKTWVTVCHCPGRIPLVHLASKYFYPGTSVSIWKNKMHLH